MNKSILAALLVAASSLPALAQQQITVVNFGGANANAQKKAYYEPFEKTGTNRQAQLVRAVLALRPAIRATSERALPFASHANH
jgi:spermidine/putrescine-binding protein